MIVRSFLILLATVVFAITFFGRPAKSDIICIFFSAHAPASLPKLKVPDRKYRAVIMCMPRGYRVLWQDV